MDMDMGISRKDVYLDCQGLPEDNLEWQ
jgi:hypothetical protein